jgi:hypothetical protein
MERRKPYRQIGIARENDRKKASNVLIIIHLKKTPRRRADKTVTLP